MICALGNIHNPPFILTPPFINFLRVFPTPPFIPTPPLILDPRVQLLHNSVRDTSSERYLKSELYVKQIASINPSVGWFYSIWKCYFEFFKVLLLGPHLSWLSFFEFCPFSKENNKKYIEILLFFKLALFEALVKV